MDKQKFMVFLVIVCVAIGALAVFTVVKAIIGPSWEATVPDIWAVYKCTNTDCGDVFNEKVDKAALSVGLTADAPPVRCPKCGQETAHRARLCSECRTWVIPKFSAGGSMTCPKCGGAFPAIKDMDEGKG